MAGTALLSAVGAVGTLGTIIQAQQITDIQNRERDIRNSLQRLQEQNESLTKTVDLLNQEVRALTSAGSLSLLTSDIKETEEDLATAERKISTCQTSIGSLCMFVS